MIVLIDAGNTNLKIAYITSAGPIKRISLCQFYESIEKVEKVIYAVVAESVDLNKILSSCLTMGIPTKKVTVTKSFNNIECGYDVIKSFGVDRWLAIIGARQTYKDDNLVIVDSGTAITIDVCIHLKHIGGWIAPGLTLMQTSIVEKAPGVFTSTDIKDELFGTNTPSALYHGCIYSLVGMIENAQNSLIKLKNLEENSVKIILTGGDASLMSEYLSLPCVVNKELVFLGLKEFAQ